MTEHPNVALMRKGYEAFANGDMETVKGLFAEDIVWHQPGNNILAGDYKGHDEVFGMFARLIQETGGNFSQEIHDVLANDEHAVAMLHARAERNGKTWEGPVVHVFHVKDSKVTEYWAFGQDTQEVDEFWS